MEDFKDISISDVPPKRGEAVTRRQTYAIKISEYTSSISKSGVVEVFLDENGDELLSYEKKCSLAALINRTAKKLRIKVKAFTRNGRLFVTREDI